MQVSPLQQVHIGTGPDGIKTNDGTFAQEYERLQSTLVGLCPAHLWYNGSHTAGCPRPILIGKHHQQQLEKLHEALTIAITDIVRRWWSDPAAGFYKRMPLEKEEEDLLKWLDTQVSLGNLREFSECLGSWRPDFLVEDGQLGHDGTMVVEENFSITEINARFPFNGFMHEAYGQKAVDEVLKERGVGATGLSSATDPEVLLGGLFSLFKPNLPLHLLKGRENGIDIHMFIDAVWHRFGVKPRLITPAELRLVPDRQNKTGYRLCCTSKGSGEAYEGETLEEIHQIGVELHQSELVALQPEMLRQLSLRCFNDVRTILLVHDKRMLGIVRQELQNMVARQVLSPAQADALDRGIAHTMLPGSKEIQNLLKATRDCPQLKDRYMIKPIRSGKGQGIVFGEDFSPDDWISALDRLQTSDLVLDTACVVQRRIIPRLYDMTLKPSGGIDRYPLVGTYHVTNRRLLGLGIWRASEGRIAAVSCGGSWICSVIRPD